MPDVSAANPVQLPFARLRKNTFVASLVACILLALLTRWIFLGKESLWFDEGWTWWLVSHPAGEMLRLIRADTVAPAYFYLLHLWKLIFGDSEAALRSLSALFMTLALIPWAIIARRSLSSRVPIVTAAAFVAWSAMQSQYAREARPYALLTLLTMTALACVPTLAARRSWPAMILFAACVAGGMYTHNVMGFYAVSLAGAWLVWPGERPLRGRLIDLAIVVGFCIAAYLPWLPFLREQTRFVDGNFWVSKPGPVQICVIISTVFGVDVYDVTYMFWRFIARSPGAGSLGVFVTVCTSVIIVLALCRSDAAARRRALAIAIVAIGPMLGVFIYSRFKQPIFLGRLFVNTSALIPILLAMSLERRRLRSVRITAGVMTGAMAVLGIIGTIAMLETPQKEDWRSLTDYVAKLPPDPRRLIVFMATEGELPYLYYVSKDPGRLPEHRTGAPGGFFDIDPPRTIRRVRVEADLDAMRAKLATKEFDEVVLVLSHHEWVDPNGLTRAYFEKNWTAGDQGDFRHIRTLRFFAKS